MEKENFGEFLIRNLWQVKFWSISVCLFSLYMSQNIIKSWWTTSNLPNLPRFSSGKILHYTVVSYRCNLDIIQYNSMFTRHLHAPYLHVDHWFCMLLVSSLLVILHVIEMTHQCTRIMQANLVYVCEPHHKHKRKPQDVDRHNSYLDVLYNI